MELDKKLLEIDNFFNSITSEEFDEILETNGIKEIKSNEEFNKNKTFTKKDLKTGMIAKTKNNQCYIVVGQYFYNYELFVVYHLDNYLENLTEINYYGSDYEGNDVEEIYDLKSGLDFKNVLNTIYNNNKFLDSFIEKKYVDLIWKRKVKI